MPRRELPPICSLNVRWARKRFRGLDHLFHHHPGTLHVLEPELDLARSEQHVRRAAGAEHRDGERQDQHQGEQQAGKELGGNGRPGAPSCTGSPVTRAHIHAATTASTTARRVGRRRRALSRATATSAVAVWQYCAWPKLSRFIVTLRPWIGHRMWQASLSQWRWSLHATRAFAYVRGRHGAGDPVGGPPGEVGAVPLGENRFVDAPVGADLGVVPGHAQLVVQVVVAVDQVGDGEVGEGGEAVGHPGGMNTPLSAWSPISTSRVAPSVGEPCRRSWSTTCARPRGTYQ